MNAHGEIFIDRKSCKPCESTVKIKKKNYVLLHDDVIWVFAGLILPPGPSVVWYSHNQ